MRILALASGLKNRFFAGAILGAVPLDSWNFAHLAFCAVADIYLGATNGPTLRITSDTTIVIVKLAFAGTGEDILSETILDLRKGRILGSVRQVGPFSLYEIKTPTGLARTVGGDYDISTKKNELGKFESRYVCTGQMMVTSLKDGVEHSWITKTRPPQN